MGFINIEVGGVPIKVEEGSRIVFGAGHNFFVLNPSEARAFSSMKLDSTPTIGELIAAVKKTPAKSYPDEFPPGFQKA